MTVLSPREKQVCNMVVQGITTREIAMSLGISPRTVEDHRRAIMRKHDVYNVVQLVRAVYGITEAAE